MLLCLHLLPLRPFARIHRARPQQLIRAGGESDSISPPPCKLGADIMADLEMTAEQPGNEKTTAYRTNTSKQKTTNEEKQAKEKELD